MPRIATPVSQSGSTSVMFLDISGQDSKCSVGGLTASPTPTQVTALANALGDVSNAAVIGTTLNAQVYDNVAARVAFDEAFASVTTVGVIVFQNSTRQTRRISIPAIDRSFFGSDGRTLNLADPLIVAVTDAVRAMIGTAFVPVRGFLSNKTRKTRTVTAPPAALEPGAAQNPPALPASV